MQNLDFFLLISIYIQKIKARYYASQEELKNKEYSDLIGWENVVGCPFQNNRLGLFFSLMSIYLLKIKVSCRTS